MNKLLKVFFIFCTTLILQQSVYAALTPEACEKLRATVQEGDIVFTHADNFVLRRVSQLTQSWANHNGIVIRESDKYGHDYLMVAHSTFPIVTKTDLCHFVSRSPANEVAIRRIATTTLTEPEMENIKTIINDYMGTLYDLHFNYFASGQFCSKFVYQIFHKELGLELGKLETLQAIYERAPEAVQQEQHDFWTAWFGGEIPWGQITILPDSQYQDQKLTTILDTSL